jgi:spore germination protein KC
MHNYKKFIVAALFLLTILTSGCWDLKELQDRNFVLAVAVDSAKDANTAEDKVASFVQTAGDKDYKLSLHMVKLTPLSGDEKTAQPSKTFIFSTTGKSMFEMIRDMLGQSSKTLFFEDLDAIIISEDAIKINGINPILDFFRRDPEMRWRTKVFIALGNAKKIIEMKMPTGEAVGPYLSGIANNHKKNLHITAIRTDLGYISQRMDNNEDIMIPRLEASNNVLKAGGSAIFKDGRLVCYADEYIAQGLKFIFATEKSGVFPVECPNHPGELFIFELFEHNTTLNSHIDEQGNVYFTLDIQMIGNVGEVTCSRQHDTKDFTYIANAEQLVAKGVTINIQRTLHFLQEYQVDPLKFREKFKGQHPFQWNKIKDHWDDIYPTIPFYISTNVVIRQLGEHY